MAKSNSLSVNEQVEKVLEAVKNTGCYRSLEKQLLVEEAVADFTTNDYIGLRNYSEQELIQCIQDSEDNALTDALCLYNNYKAPFGGSTGSRLISGNTSFVRTLENFFAQSYSEATESQSSCLLFNSGYHANVGIIPALTELASSTCVLFDQLSHASIIDGVLLANVPFKRFRHNDLEHLEELLETAVQKYDNIIVVIESIYSMDGDGIFNLQDLVLLKAKYSEQANIILYCDEAHAIGLFGDYCFGRVEEENLARHFDVVVAPCGKALNSYGCLVFTNSLMHDFLVNRCRTFIYSTALPASVHKHLFLSYLACRTETFKESADEILARSEILRQDLMTYILDTYSDVPNIREVVKYMVIGEFQITGLILGSNEAVLRAKDIFLKHNVLISAIRYPTVAKGNERLRISLSACDDLDSQLDLFHEAFTELLSDPLFEKCILQLSEDFNESED